MHQFFPLGILKHTKALIHVHLAVSPRFLLAADWLLQQKGWHAYYLSKFTHSTFGFILFRPAVYVQSA